MYCTFGEPFAHTQKENLLPPFFHPVYSEVLKVLVTVVKSYWRSALPDVIDRSCCTLARLSSSFSGCANVSSHLKSFSPPNALMVSRAFIFAINHWRKTSCLAMTLLRQRDRCAAALNV